MISTFEFILAIAYMVVIILLTEAYPPNVQSIGTGFVEAVGQAGAFLGPVVINLCISLQVYPILVISVIAIVMIVIPITGMVETLPGHSEVVPENIKTSGLRFVGSAEHKSQKISSSESKLDQ